MKQYNLFHPMLLSFFSKSLYRDVARNWKGTGFFYLFILLLICWLPLTYVIHNQVNTIAKSSLPPLISQIPAITIKHGEVSIDKPVPYFIHNPGDKKVLAIIDTSGQFNNLQGADATVLLTKNKLYVQSNNEVKEYDLSKIEDKIITQDTVSAFIKTGRHWIIILLFPVLLLISYVYRIAQAFLYAVIGALVFNNILHAKLDFQQILRLSVIAVTPVIILGTVLDLFGIVFQYQWLLYFFIAMFYLFFAIRVNAEAAEVVNG